MGAPKSIEEAYAENPARVKCTDHGLVTSDRIRITGCTKMPDINNLVFAIVKVDDDYFTLKDETDTTPIDGSEYSIGAGDWGEFEEVTKTVTGLTHLNAKEVAVMGDGATLTKGTVAGGEITLASWVNTAHVGLSYTAIISPMPLVASAYGGLKKSRVFRALVRLYKTVCCLVGPDEDHTHSMGTMTEPFTGLKTIPIEGDFEDESTIVLVNDEPQPFTVLSIAPEMEVNAG